MKYNQKYSYMNTKYNYNYNCINMKVLTLNDFMKKFNLKNDTIKESQLQKMYNYPIYPRGSKIYSDKGFVCLDNGVQGGTH